MSDTMIGWRELNDHPGMKQLANRLFQGPRLSRNERVALAQSSPQFRHPGSATIESRLWDSLTFKGTDGSFALLFPQDRIHIRPVAAYVMGEIAIDEVDAIVEAFHASVEDHFRSCPYHVETGRQ